MNREEQEEFLENMFVEMRSVILSKGNDYANDDRLSNFKLAGTICGLTTEQNCLSLIATKVARLGVLFNSNSEPSFESVEDSILDLANYSTLLAMIIYENRMNSND